MAEATKTEAPTVDALEVEEPVETTPEPTAAAPPDETPATPETRAAAEPPPHPEDAALGFLLGAHGPGFEAELSDAISKLQSRLDALVEHRRNMGGRGPQDLKAFIVEVTQYIRRRRGLEERRDRVRKMLDPRAAAPPPGKHEADEVKELVGKAWGPEAAPVLRKIQAEIEATVRKRIDRTDEKLGRLQAPNWFNPRHHHHTPDYRHADRVAGAPAAPDVRLAHEPILDEASAHLTARRADENLLARLTQDQDLAVRACRDACAKAIEDAGGVEVIARAYREQQLLGERWWQADPDYPKLSAAEAGLRTANEQANRLGVDATIPPEKGTYAARLVAQATDAAAQVAKLKGEIDGRRKVAALELVERAAAGDEPSRAEVSNSAARLRAAFPPGFAEAIHHAQFQGSEFGALVDELTANPA